MRLALDVRVKNGVLMEFVQKVGSGAEAARVLGVTHSELSAWLSMRHIPGKKLLDRVGYRVESSLSLVLGRDVSIADVWPTDMRAAVAAKLLPKKTVKFVEYEPMQLSAVPVAMLPPIPPDVARLESGDLMEKVMAEAYLCEREREVITLRFGLDGGGERTLQEIGVRLDRSIQRIRDIEGLALVKIRKAGRRLGFGENCVPRGARPEGRQRRRERLDREAGERLESILLRLDGDAA